MRYKLPVGFLFAAAVFAQALPTFQLDPSKWLESQRRPAQAKPVVKMAVPQQRCAIRLREIEPPAKGAITVIQPDVSRSFSSAEAVLPAPVCDKR